MWTYSKGFKRLDEEERQITDIDIITYKPHVSRLDSVLTELSYTPDFRIAMYYGDSRRIYYSKDGSHQVDVFIDRLKYNHNIDFGKPGKGRLELDFSYNTPSRIYCLKSFKSIGLLRRISRILSSSLGHIRFQTNMRGTL